MGFDVAVIGGGIIGTSAAAFLAEAGRAVVLLERSYIAAAASGRNSGVLQDPLDPALSALHSDSMAVYRDLTADGELELSAEPDGLLLVARDDDEWPATAAAQLASLSPQLEPQALDARAARQLEPALGEGIAAIRLASGRAVVPAAVTHAFAARARRSGATLRFPVDARPWLSTGRLAGVELASGERIACEQVLVAAGPWSPTLVPGWRDDPPIHPTYGVVVGLTLDLPPRLILEELGIDPGGNAAASFSLVTAGGISSLGSTFLLDEPEPAALAPTLIARGSAFVPALARAQVAGTRGCARPVSFDGRPLIGPVATDGLFACAGHGPWGISTGPASARIVVRQMLGWPAGDPATESALAADRWPPNGHRSTLADKRLP